MFGLSVLPPAKTYGRIWKARIAAIHFDPLLYQGEWSKWENIPDRIDDWKVVRYTPVIDPYEGSVGPPQFFQFNVQSGLMISYPFPISLE